MDDKYQVPGKSRKPATKQEELQLKIEELVRRRDAAKEFATVQQLNAEITKLFAQYQRAKL